MSNILSIAHRHGENDRTLSDDAAVVLRKWLAMAEAGEIISVGLVGEAVNGDPMHGHSLAAKRMQVIAATLFCSAP